MLRIEAGSVAYKAITLFTVLSFQLLPLFLDAQFCFEYICWVISKKGDKHSLSITQRD